MEVESGVSPALNAGSGNNWTKVCPHGHRVVKAEGQFCEECGETLKISCGACGAVQGEKSGQFCVQCGQGL